VTNVCSDRPNSQTEFILVCAIWNPSIVGFGCVGQCGYLILKNTPSGGYGTDYYIISMGRQTVTPNVIIEIL